MDHELEEPGADAEGSAEERDERDRVSYEEPPSGVKKYLYVWIGAAIVVVYFVVRLWLAWHH